MYQQLLVDFISEYLRKGTSKDDIRSALNKAGGWTPEEIDGAFSAVEAKGPITISKPVTPVSPSPVNNIPKPVMPATPITVPSKPSVPPAPSLKNGVVGFQTVTPAPSPIPPKPSIPLSTPPMKTMNNGGTPPVSPIVNKTAIPPTILSEKSVSPAFNRSGSNLAEAPIAPSNKMAKVSLYIVSSLALVGFGAFLSYYFYFVPKLEEVSRNIALPKGVETGVGTNVGDINNPILPPVINPIPSVVDQNNVLPTTTDNVAPAVTTNPEPTPTNPSAEPTSNSKPFVND